MRKFFLAILIALVTSACQQAPVQRPPIVRPETQVLDSNARHSLEELRSDGTLVFQGSAAYRVGDVLVSEPAPGAPQGLLRRVTMVEQTGGKTLVHTEQARIGDALQRGSLRVDRELTEADLASVTTLSPGVRYLGGLKPLANDGFRLAIDIKFGEANLEPPTISGELRFKPVIKVDLDLDCGPLCLYDNDLDFLAQVGIQLTSDLKVSGKSGYNLKYTVQLAAFEFSPLVFYIGPVPVVITPKIVVEIRTDGSVYTDVSYQVGGSLTAVAGAKYDSDWRNISELNYRFTAGAVDAPFPLAGVAKAKALAALRGELAFYGVAGPTVEIAPFVDFDLVYPRDPILKLSAGVQGNVGIRVNVLGYTKHYQTNLWDESVELYHSGNTAPQVRFRNPNTGDIGWCCTLRVEVVDYEDGPACCTVTFRSSNPADGAGGILGSGSGSQAELAYLFTTLGKRIITAAATDSKGKTGISTLELDVVNTPPTVAIHTPVNGQQFYRGVSYTLRGVSYDPNEPDYQLPCSNMAWRDESTPLGTGCDLAVSFTSNGNRTLTLTGTDTHGGSGSASVNVSVVDPPANLPPVVNITSPQNGITLGPDQVVKLLGSASDPEGGAVTLAWDVTTGYDPGTGLGANTYPVTPAPNGDWKPTDSLPYTACEVNDTLRLRLKAKDPQNNEGFDFIVIRVVRIC